MKCRMNITLTFLKYKDRAYLEFYTEKNFCVFHRENFCVFHFKLKKYVKFK